MPKESITPELCLAIIEGKPKEIDSLVGDSDFDPNKKTNAGYSPLYYAVKEGNFELVKVLAEKKANLGEKYDGLTLRDIVKQKIEMAEQYKANVGDKKRYENIDNFLKEKKIPFNQKALAAFAKQIKIPVRDSQSWIRYPLQVMGYEYKAGGYCRGVARMGVEAFLLEERDKNNNLIHFKNFSNRIKNLSHTSNEDILDIIHSTKHKKLLHIELVKKSGGAITQKSLDKEINKRLTQEDQIKTEFEPFFDGIEIYQQTYKHNELLPKKVNQQDFISGIPLVMNAALKKQGGTLIADHFSGVYSEEELLKILQEVEKLAKNNNYSSPVALHMDANRHSIAIGYDPVKERWSYINANRPHMDMAFTAEGIKNAIRSGLFVKAGEPLLIETNIFSTAVQYQDLKEKVTDPLRNTEAWKAAHAVTEEKLNFKDKAGLRLEARAKHNEDTDIVNSINKFGNFFSRNKNTLLLAGAFLLGGAALIATGVLSLGIVPAVLAVVTLGLGAAGIGIGGGIGIGIGIRSVLKTGGDSKQKFLDEVLKANKDEALKPNKKEEIELADLPDSTPFMLNRLKKLNTEDKPLTELSSSTQLMPKALNTGDKLKPFISSCITSLTTYHGKIDSLEAGKKLADQPEGTYLIRYSTKRESFYVSVKTGNSTKEIPLPETPNFDLEKFLQSIKESGNYKYDLKPLSSAETGLQFRM